MSNSIWKTPDDIKLDANDSIVFDAGIALCTGYYDHEVEMFIDMPSEDAYEPDEVIKYALVTDLIAAADRAERLEKAVDCALEELQRVAEDEDIDWLRAESARTTIDEIKQLIKEKPMTSKLKCPVCQWCNQPMVLQDDIFVCANTGCSACAESFLHKALTQAKQDLEIATKALEEIAEREDDDVFFSNKTTAKEALEQIERKEGKC